MVNLMELEALRIEEQDLSSADLTLQADSGESLEILARGHVAAADDDIIEESIDEELMLAYPSTDAEAEVFPGPVVDNMNMDLLGLMRDKGFEAPTLKIPEGDEYRVSTDGTGGTFTVMYAEMGPSGVRDGTPGTPGTKTRTFITSSSTTESVAAGATESFELDTSQNPGILRDYPWEEDVPPGTEYDLQAIMFALDSTDAGANVTLDSFRLQSEERDFISRDSAFIDTDLAQYPNDDLTTIPFAFPETPTFSPGDEFDVQVEASNSGGGAEDAVVDATAIFYRRDVGV